jgi:hypothetical protein
MVKRVHQWRLKSLILSILCLPAFSFSAGPAADEHPYYVSVVEINHNATDKILEITCKIFIDDFQKALGKKYNVSVDLINPKDKAAVNNMVSDYIKSHLSFRADGKTANFSYLGYEISEEAAWSYYQADNIASVKNLEITNSVLHDYIDKQINIIHVIVNGERKSTRLDYPKTAANFQW